MSYTRQKPKPYDITRKNPHIPKPSTVRKVQQRRSQQKFDNEVRGAIDRYLKRRNNE